MIHEVSVEFPFNQDWADTDGQVKAAAEQHDGVCVSSRAGFGARDLQFQFESQDDADQFCTALSSLPGVTREVTEVLGDCRVCGEPLDRDCRGRVRCATCDGPCPDCDDGGGPV